MNSQTHREWITGQMGAAVNALDAMTHDEIRNLNVDCFIVGYLLGHCDHIETFRERITQLRGIAERAGAMPDPMSQALNEGDGVYRP